jgi:hypothetical protein
VTARAALLLVLVCACGHAAQDTASVPAASPADLARASTELAELRAGEPKAAYGLRVRVRYTTPGGTMDGRGGIAVDPHNAMRMILVGPGGATAIDAWVTKDRWRFAVPALDKVQRGEGDAPAGLPIGFFRFWFLAPLRGDLVTVQAIAGGGERLIVKDGPAVVDLRDVHEPPLLHLTAMRRAEDRTETLDWRGRSLAPSVGDRASYAQPEAGLRIDVVVEAVSADPPDAEAFVDPDAPKPADTQL